MTTDRMMQLLALGPFGCKADAASGALGKPGEAANFVEEHLNRGDVLGELAALMFDSYRMHGPIQIIRYANRIEVRNPGHSIKAEEQLGEPGSEARNPRIAAVLHDVNIAETKGSGIRAMRELMLAQGLLPPAFESTRRPDQFVATFLFHHFLGNSDLAWLRSLTYEPLSDEEARALVFVREAGAIDNAAYRAINRTDTLERFEPPPPSARSASAGHEGRGKSGVLRALGAV